MQLEDEHSTLSSSASDESTLFLDEATSFIKSNLHSFHYNLADGDQILRDGQYMQDIFNVSLVAFFAE